MTLKNIRLPLKITVIETSTCNLRVQKFDYCFLIVLFHQYVDLFRSAQAEVLLMD